MLGQPASSQTVCKPSRLTRLSSSEYSGPIFALVLIQFGLRSIGVSAFRISRRSNLRPSGATVTRTMLRPARRARRAGERSSTVLNSSEGGGGGRRLGRGGVESDPLDVVFGHREGAVECCDDRRRD